MLRSSRDSAPTKLTDIDSECTSDLGVRVVAATSDQHQLVVRENILSVIHISVVHQVNSQLSWEARYSVGPSK